MDFEKIVEEALEHAYNRMDKTYCDYIDIMKKDECKGIDYKIGNGSLLRDNLDKINDAYIQLGKHRAFYEMRNFLQKKINKLPRKKA